MNAGLLDEDVVIAADIGGSHITVAPVNLSSATTEQDKLVRVRINSKGTKKEILQSWLQALEHVFSACAERPNKLAVAMPGPFDYQQGIAYMRGMDKYEHLYGTSIRQVLAEGLGIPDHQVLFRNDAEAFLHGEVATNLVGKDERVLGLTLGTGMGTAFSYERKTVDINLGSEHYQASIADDYFTTRWFKRRCVELGGVPIDGVEQLTAGAGKNKIVDLIFEEYATCLAAFLAPHLKRLDIDTVVFGGNITKAYTLFLPQLLTLWADAKLTPAVKLAQQGEQSAMIGAAFLFEDQNNSFKYSTIASS